MGGIRQLGETEKSKEEIGHPMGVGTDQSEFFDRCKRIDNMSNVVPGWGCCKCHVYNNYGRKVCKQCGHIPCYPPKGEVSDDK
jgi:hypothetical protein